MSTLITCRVPDSLPVVQVKYSLNTFRSQPETNHMLNRLTISFLQHKMKGQPCMCLLSY